MKKLLSLILLSIVSITFVACTNDSSNNKNKPVFKNGVYTAQGQQDGQGWTDFVIIDVKDTKISKVTFDAKKSDSSLKSQDEEFNNNYKAEKGIDAKTAYSQLADKYFETKDISEVKKMDSDKNLKDSFIKLVTALEPKLKEGNTALLIVDNTVSE